MPKNSIHKLRKELLNESFRKKFFSDNKKNFEKNALKIINKVKTGKFKIYVVAGNFLGKKIMPYDYDSFSATNLLAATKKQGYEIMLFLNKARLEFLSLRALMHILLHEIEHVKQAEKNAKEFLLSMLNDKISRKLEKQADKAANLKEEKREYALESILYCYELGGWKAAEKMAEFLFNHDKLYGGGYEKELSKKEYKVFLDAKKKKDIGLFVDIFI